LKLNRDFRELLECFARHEVRYLILGGGRWLRTASSG
jgi:hypothetical protein